MWTPKKKERRQNKTQKSPTTVHCVWASEKTSQRRTIMETPENLRTQCMCSSNIYTSIHSQTLPTSLRGAVWCTSSAALFLLFKLSTESSLHFSQPLSQQETMSGESGRRIYSITAPPGVQERDGQTGHSSQRGVCEPSWL